MVHHNGFNCEAGGRPSTQRAGFGHNWIAGNTWTPRYRADPDLGC